jgi:hypothetical protein
MVRLVALVLIAVTMFACSSDDTSSSDSLPVQAREKDVMGLLAASKIITGALIEADGNTIYAQMSNECKKQVTPAGLNQQLKTGQAFLKSFVGVEISDIEIAKYETQKVKNGESGEVRFTIDVAGDSKEALERYIDQQSSTTVAGSSTTTTAPSDGDAVDQPTDWFAFVYEDGIWRLDDCEDFLQQVGLLNSQSGS